MSLTGYACLQNYQHMLHETGNSIERKKLAFVTSAYPITSQTFITQEIAGLSRRGFKIEIFPLRNTDMQTGKDNLKIHRIGFIFNTAVWKAFFGLLITRPGTWAKCILMALRAYRHDPGRFLRSLFLVPKAMALGEIVKNNGFDLICVHFMSHPATMARIMSAVSGIKWGLTCHGSDIRVYPPDDMADRIIEACYTITVAKKNRQYLKQVCGARVHDMIRVIPNGVDPSLFPYIDRKERAEDIPSILCVARFHPVKGIDILLRACGELVKRGIAFKCHVYGYGAQKNELLHLVQKLGLAGNVILHSDPSRKQVIASYTAADIYALPSRSEGLPVALLEAMASGLPIVAASVGGVDELVFHGKNGFLSLPEDPVSMAENLSLLLGDISKRLAMGKEGRAIFEAKYRADKALDAKAELIRNHIGKV